MPRAIWADPLDSGPVPGRLTDAELVDVRVRHLGPPPDPETDLREWRLAIGRHDSYDEINLWFEHDVFDQLNLIQLLTFLRASASATKRVSLICIGRSPAAPAGHRLAARPGLARVARVPPDDAGRPRRASPRGHVRAAVPGRRGDAIAPGISMDDRRTLANGTPSPGSRERSEPLAVEGVSTDG
jgi:hypothetical protein